MSEENGTTTTATMWQDRHSGLRRHRLMTKELGEKIPALYANDDVEDYDSVVAHVKLFSPYAGWRWYVTEWEAETGLCFGLVEGFENELGYFSLDELAEATVLGGIPRRGARPLLGVEDHRRDQRTAFGDGGLASGARKHGQSIR